MPLSAEPDALEPPAHVAEVVPFPLDETDLVRRVARGDRTAFSHLYDAVSARVHGVVSAFVHDEAQAAEVTEEVFLEVWRTATRFDGGLGGAEAWITSLAHRRAVERARTTGTTPVAPTVEHERLAFLTPLQRDSIALAWFGGHTCHEAAAALGVGRHVVSACIRDGLHRLRRVPAAVV